MIDILLSGIRTVLDFSYVSANREFDSIHIIFDQYFNFIFQCVRKLIPISIKKLWYIRRVRYLDGKALILDINYFLTEFVPGLTPEIAANSIYDYIENTLGMQIITSKRRITVEHATAQDEKVLAMDSYDCVAVVTDQTFNASGMLFEFTQSRHQPDYFCFQDIATRKK